MRVALYARVSTEEQVRHGISIEAQLAALRSWAEREGHTIAGEYVDEGVSARKAPAKRPELQRLLSDLAPLEIGLIAFAKLDRWTRNVKGYYQVQDTLDRHKVAWIAIQEDYETITASGRFKVNIMLSVAENEADRTSERIKAVFEHKVEKGESLGGRPLIGYMTENKRLVPNPETADAARLMFRTYLETASYYETARRMSELLPLKLQYHYLRRLLSNTIYIGEYRGNTAFCEPIIPRDEFDAVQRLMSERSVRKNQTGRVYLFSGLAVCACCGLKMSGFSLPKSNGDDYYYRCASAVLYHRCEHRHAIREDRLERWMLAGVDEAFAAYRDDLKVQAAKRKPPAVDHAAIERKLEKLKDLYLDDLITKEQYKADREKYMEQLKQSVPAPPPQEPESVRVLLSGEFQDIYKTLGREERREFWRGLVKAIELDAENTPRIIFA